MAESIDQLFSAVSVSQSDPYDTFKQHPRFAQYKSTTLPDQHARRQKELERQKRKRSEAYNLLRHLEDEVTMEIATAEPTESKCEDMKPASKRSQHKTKSYKPYANQGRTTAYSRKGNKISRFNSALPGGSAGRRAPMFETSSDKIYASLNDIKEYPIDGLLFYHKDGHYKPGEKSSLVNWLKPHMVPEILGYPVPEKYKQAEIQMAEN
ncbi:uncharacterized protein TRIADDRAFT_60372 [Trichoplax adhaerens]|uniref:Snurportin-1 n=1 Tax=Trichoplax adhaerens TaxID=10228 RepID=B3S816_TRIAD|nr:hypothetical protein TRIADDRAFT_60372 [Trichoplax adhaerens]EDV21115.1 hypothetical protein TRIADDRAFT_60372 [Trichoplax adhaerens]|eukprot:XP_002116445.1 hypothetical protein TRIADDRAFT_60372 [Trichoplax adhaerens]